ncbi:MAG: hypothetical protein K2P71_12875, partial [Lachnospiraceae bacterium]|nr:hypothetical protein [Lachnospiraceae bacterium]
LFYNDIVLYLRIAPRLVLLPSSISQDRAFYIEAFPQKVVKKLQTVMNLVYNNTTERKDFSNNAVKKEIS